jgi:signal transduction histidine kinase
MKALSSLQNRVFLASAVVALLSIVFAIRFVTVRLGREAEAQLRKGLRESATLVQENYAARLDTLSLLARLIADLPKLKAAVETGDPPTVRPLALDYKARVKADLLAVTNREGTVLVALGGADTAPADRGSTRTDLAGQESTTLRATPEGALQQIVTVPIAIGIEPPEVLGALTLGFALNDQLAAQLKAVTASEVALVEGRRILASTLPHRYDAILGALAADGPATAPLDGNEYVALRQPLESGPGQGQLAALVLRSRTERLEFLQTLRAALAFAAVVAVFGAVLLSYAISRTVTRPLAAITATMRDVAATGDLTRKIALPGGWYDEDARVVASTFNTFTDSIARFQQEAALRERLSALGRLSTVIAHEVRNPLMIIKTALRSLRREGASAPEIQDAAADIDQEVARLNRIVGDVLDFARPLKLAYGPADLNALCREAVAAARAAEPSPDFRLSLEEAMPAIVTDGERLRTALVNVLSNARDAVIGRLAGRDGGEADVEVTTRALGPERVAIVIEDRGEGIDPADLPHIFEPYYTTKRTGTGLGLAIARNIVDALGGVLSATSRPGDGTTIRIELPVAAAPPGAPATASVLPRSS